MDRFLCFTFLSIFFLCFIILCFFGRGFFRDPHEADSLKHRIKLLNTASHPFRHTVRCLETAFAGAVIGGAYNPVEHIHAYRTRAAYGITDGACINRIKTKLVLRDGNRAVTGHFCRQLQVIYQRPEQSLKPDCRRFGQCFDVDSTRSQSDLILAQIGPVFGIKLFRQLFNLPPFQNAQIFLKLECNTPYRGFAFFFLTQG